MLEEIDIDRQHFPFLYATSSKSMQASMPQRKFDFGAKSVEEVLSNSFDWRNSNSLSLRVRFGRGAPAFVSKRSCCTPSALNFSPWVQNAKKICQKAEQQYTTIFNLLNRQN